MESDGTERVYGPYELTVDGPAPVASAWDAGYEDIGSGWRRLAWFGDYIPMGSDGWVWHNQHGFFYLTPDSSPNSVWIFANDMGWIWTASTVYPFLYRASDGAWLWYNSSLDPRWFFNLTAGQWETWP